MTEVPLHLHLDAQDLADSLTDADFLQSIIDPIRDGIVNQFNSMKNMNATGSSSRVTVSYSLPNADDESSGFADLKPYFANSSKVKYTKDGNWYLKVPINNSYGKLQNALSGNEYKTLLDLTMGQTASLPGIQNLKSVDNAVSAINYQWKSNNITKTGNGSGNQGIFTAFRTVSSKSDPNSWLLQKGSDGGKTKDKLEEVDETIKKGILASISGV